MKPSINVCIFVLPVLVASTSCAEFTDCNSEKISDPVAFVRSIELAQPRYNVLEALKTTNLTLAAADKLSLPPDNKKEGYIVGGGITAFTENVKGLSKRDVIDATLFAQLAADREYDREKSSLNWYHYYQYVLANIGFKFRSFDFQQYIASGDTITIDKVVIKILSTIATGPQSVVINETLKVLKSMPNNENCIALFSQQSSTSSSGSFQVYPVEQSPDGEVSMAMGAFYFTATHHETQFLFFSWGSTTDISIYKEAETAVLDQGRYDKIRSDISAKLGSNAVNLVSSIDL